MWPVLYNMLKNSVKKCEFDCITLKKNLSSLHAKTIERGRYSSVALVLNPNLLHSKPFGFWVMAEIKKRHDS